MHFFIVAQKQTKSAMNENKMKETENISAFFY